MSGRLQPGTTLGAFEIVDFVAAGGMGSVYKARNRISGEVRALKVILPELASNRDFVARFIREIRIAASIEHPNLVRVLEPAMDGETVFLPMELLHGEPLSAFVRRSGRLSVQQTLAIVRPVCDAIAAVHARGIIHRDLKPANIFLATSASGIAVPKVLDFGAAREVDPEDEHTRAGSVIGSPHYMAYEQAVGQRDLDGRVDQYALGVITYQLLTGTRPYENDDTGHVLAKVLQGAVYSPPRQLVPDLPAGLESAILRAMSRRRDERFASVSDFAAALAPFASDDDATIVRPPAADVGPAASNGKHLVASPPPPRVADRARPVEAAPPPAATPEDRALEKTPPLPMQSSSWVSFVVAGCLLMVLAMAGWNLFAHRSSPEPTPSSLGARTAADASIATRDDAAAPAPRLPLVPITSPQLTQPASVEQDAGERRPSVHTTGSSHGSPRTARCVPRPGVPCI